jgi:3-deoxy-D-manno-octulosonic-acid transferase
MIRPLLTTAELLWITTSPRARGDWKERLGLARAPVGPGVLWVHGSSLGEAAAVLAVARAWVAADEGRRALVTADTDTGVARLREGADGWRIVAQARPLDRWSALAPVWADARPLAVVFVEGAWWPGLAGLARSQGVPVLRIGARAGRRTRALAPLGYGRFAGEVTAVWAVDEGHAAFFRRYTDAPVVVGGDPKLSGSLREGPRHAAFVRWLAGRPLVVGASTREGDEEALVEAFRALPEGAALVLAPRVVARAPALLSTTGRPPRVALSALTEADGAESASRAEASLGSLRERKDRRGSGPVPEDSVLVVDTLGDLPGIVGLARVVFVGGTFDPVLGGHSPAEARIAGAAVVAGPHRQSNAAAFAAGPVFGARTPGELGRALVEAWDAPRVGLPEGDPAGGDWMSWVGTAPAPEASPRPALAPLSRLYGLGSELRNRWYDRRPGQRFGVPVISVGSTNPRSPGKTSVVRALVEAFPGLRVGVALRGVGRRSRDLEVVAPWPGPGVAPVDVAERVGDDGAWLAGAGAWVAASADRGAAVAALVAQGVDLVVLDDGLQRRSVARDLDIAVVDGENRGARGLIPEGERREVGVSPRAGLVVCFGGEALPGELVGRRVLGDWIRADGVVMALPVGPFSVLAGTGRPDRLVAGLPRAPRRVVVLGDHAWPGDLDEGIWVCAAKDATKLALQVRGRVWLRDLRAEVPGLSEAVQIVVKGQLGHTTGSR